MSSKSSTLIILGIILFLIGVGFYEHQRADGVDWWTWFIIIGGILFIIIAIIEIMINIRESVVSPIV